jgi:hypothetical protein
MTTDLDRVLAAVSAGGVTRAYKLNEVPDAPVTPYTVVAVSRDLPKHHAGTGAPGTWDLRATFQSFDSDADGALDFDRMAVDALEGQIVAGIDGLWRTQVGSALSRDPDNRGVVTVTSTLLCTVSAT